MAKKNLSPEQRAELRATLTEARRELRELIDLLELRLAEGKREIS